MWHWSQAPTQIHGRGRVKGRNKKHASLLADSLSLLLKGAMRHITHTQGDNMIGRMIFGTMWVMMWIVLFASGLGLIALLADGDYPLEQEVKICFGNYF